MPSTNSQIAGAVSSGLYSDAQAAAEIRVTDVESLGAQPLDQMPARDRTASITGCGSMSCDADVAAHAFEQQILVTPRALVDRFRFADIDAEFVRQAAGGDVGVRRGVHVGIHAQRHASLLARADAPARRSAPAPAPIRN